MTSSHVALASTPRRLGQRPEPLSPARRLPGIQWLLLPAFLPSGAIPAYHPSPAATLRCRRFSQLIGRN